MTRIINDIIIINDICRTRLLTFGTLFLLQVKEFLQAPDVMSCVVDPELKHFRDEDLKVICEVANLCIHPKTSTRTSMHDLCSMLETGIDTSISAEMKASSLAWAELALSS